MKRVFLLIVAIIAMAGISNAQVRVSAMGLKCDNGCSGDLGQCSPGFVDCSNDPENCGGVGNVCSATGATALCGQGTCWICTDEQGCLDTGAGGGGGVGGIQPSRIKPKKTFMLRLRYDEITAEMKSRRRG